MPSPPPPTKYPIKANRVIWIEHHTGCKARTKIFDLTPGTISSFNGTIDSKFKGKCKTAYQTIRKKAKTDAIIYTVTKQDFWAKYHAVFKGDSGPSDPSVELDEYPNGTPKPTDHRDSHHDVELNEADAQVPAHLFNEKFPPSALALVQSPFFSHGSTHMTFPPPSPHSSHALHFQPTAWYRRTEMYVKDSVTYTWECESKFHSWRIGLWKDVGGAQMEVARFGNIWGWGTGGILLVDTEEVTDLVAVLGAMVCLKKRRQREREWASSSGGGGGGGG